MAKKQIIYLTWCVFFCLLFQTSPNAENTQQRDENYHKHLGFKAINDGDYSFAPIQHQASIQTLLKDFHSANKMKEHHFFLDNNPFYLNEPDILYGKIVFVFSSSLRADFVQSCLTFMRLSFADKEHLDFISRDHKAQNFHRVPIHGQMTQQNLQLKRKTYTEKVMHRLGIIDSHNIFYSGVASPISNISGPLVLIIPVDKDIYKTHQGELEIETNFSFDLDYAYLLGTSSPLNREKINIDLQADLDIHHRSKLLMNITELLKSAEKYKKLQLFLYISNHTFNENRKIQLAWQKYPNMPPYKITSADRQAYDQNEEVRVFALDLESGLSKKELERKFSLRFQEEVNPSCSDRLMSRLKYIAFHSSHRTLKQ